MLLLNLNSSFINYARLLSMFQTFGKVLRIDHQTGSSHATVSMSRIDEANNAYRAFDGSDFWGQHVSIRFIPGETVSSEQLAQFNSEIAAVMKVAKDTQEKKRKPEEKEEKEDENSKRMKATNQLALDQIDDPSQSFLQTLFPPSSATSGGQQRQSPQPSETEEVSEEAYDFDLIVIGGGSGGLAAAKEASALGAKVACFDFVKPSPHGSTWGLGGACLNVGCVPKKLMHNASLIGQTLKDAKDFGWKLDGNSSHDWVKLVEAVQAEIKHRQMLHLKQLAESKVFYANSFAEFTGQHAVKGTDEKGHVIELTAKYFIISTGGRPKFLDIPGIRDYAISSDELFSLPYSPGKTLVIGASYVALECAGFLHGLGLDVTVMVRTTLLGSGDQQMAELIGSYMQNEGIKFIRPCVPTKVEWVRDGQPGRYKVSSTVDNGVQRVDTFNTVLVAVGRDPCTSELHLENVGVDVDEKGFIVCGDDEGTTCPHIFAVGDVVASRINLAPVAIQGAKLLARRLFGVSTVMCDYVNVPTTVFTPLEYGCVGMSEDDAIEKYGAEGIQVYHSNFTPLEWTVPHREENACYAKLICVPSENEKVVGLHVLGPNAGEITQGWTIGIKLGATKSDFDNAIGIHPTCAEIFTTLSITKDSGLSAEASGC